MVEVIVNKLVIYYDFKKGPELNETDYYRPSAEF